MCEKTGCVGLFFTHIVGERCPLVVLECCRCGQLWHRREDGALVSYDESLMSLGAFPGSGRHQVDREVCEAGKEKPMKKPRIGIVSSWCLALGVGAAIAWGDSTEMRPAAATEGPKCVVGQTEKLVGGGGNFFGNSVATSGNVAVVGAPLDAELGFQAGAAFAFRFNGSSWVPEGKLVAANGNAGDHAGQSVAIAGDWAFVGARYAEAVYVFHFDGVSWTQTGTLTASDGEGADYFGSSLSAYNQWVVVGAMLDDNDRGTDAGAAYVFHFDGSAWIESQKLTASNGAAGDQFSGEQGVAISADAIAVGAAVNSNARSAPGSVYVFHIDESTWVEKQKLSASDSAAGDYFGGSVQLDGRTLLVGATGAVCASGESCGAVYVFDQNLVLKDESKTLTWLQRRKMTASDAHAGDSFGIGLAIRGNVAVIGAHAADDAAANSGTAYVFHRNRGEWVQTGKLRASDGGSDAFLGVSVAMFDSSALVGAYGATPNAVYVFGSLSDCDGNNQLDSCDLADGSAQDCNDNGRLDECELAYRASWVQSDVNGHYYRLTSAPMSWPEADAEAEGLGGSLATIRSPQEETWIQETYATRVAPIYELWIGLQQPPADAEPNSGWAWMSGESLAYTNWCSGEPNDNNGEDFGEFAFFPDTAYFKCWNDDDVTGANTPYGLIERISLPTDCNGNRIPDDCELNTDDDDGDGVPNAKDSCACAPVDRVDAAGRPLGDLDGDCDVDLEDFNAMQNNFMGP